MKRKRVVLKELNWGHDGDETCMYSNGHIDPSFFLEVVRGSQVSDVPVDVREILTVDDVKHIRFRPLSPSEAQAQGFSHGVRTTQIGGYPVTAVIV